MDEDADRPPPGMAGYLGPPPPPPPPAPLLPPSPAIRLAGPAPAAFAWPPPVSDAVLAIPLGTRRLLAMSLDLLTRSDAGLRSASFYIGFVLLLAVGPLAVLFGLAWVSLGEDAFLAVDDTSAWAGWLGLAAVPAVPGYVAASVDATILAVAVIGGRAEDRPLRLPSAITIVRRRFWQVLAAQLVVGILTAVAGYTMSEIIALATGPVPALDYGVELVVGLAVGAPFVYVTAGIVLGEVGVSEAIRRSWRLVTARKALAVVVTLFGVLSQLLVVLGLGLGLDILLRVGVGTGFDADVPGALVVPVVAALVFALGTLVFLVEAVAAAPAVFAFAALTHYTNGLELGRRAPLPARRPWQPYLTLGLAVGAAVGMAALAGGILSLPA
jgi:hypothetical protein